MRRSPVVWAAMALCAPGSAAAQQPAPVAATESAAPHAADQPAAAPALDVDALRQEYLSLRDQLFRSRARAAAVASSLYSSKLRILLDYGSGRFYTVTRATVRLDGANVYDDAQGAIASDRAPRWHGFVAPGRHQITVRIEATGKDLLVKCVAVDDGDIAYQWQRSEQGNYRLRLDVAVQSVKRAEGTRGVKRARR